MLTEVRAVSLQEYGIPCMAAAKQLLLVITEQPATSVSFDETKGYASASSLSGG